MFLYFQVWAVVVVRLDGAQVDDNINVVCHTVSFLSKAVKKNHQLIARALCRTNTTRYDVLTH